MTPVERTNLYVESKVSDFAGQIKKAMTRLKMASDRAMNCLSKVSFPILEMT